VSLKCKLLPSPYPSCLGSGRVEGQKWKHKPQYNIAEVLMSWSNRRSQTNETKNASGKKMKIKSSDMWITIAQWKSHVYLQNKTKKKPIRMR